MATIDQWTTLASKIKLGINSLETMYPDSIRIKILHAQANTAAIWKEDEIGLARGTLGGADGTVHPDSGGTDKGNPV